MTIELYDHEIIAMDKGPVAWMTRMQGSSMPLEQFRRTAEAKFAEVGFRVAVKCWETTEAGTFAFDVEIIGRTHDIGEFDFDRQVHEVTHNLLDEPGVEKGFIDTKHAAAEFRRANPDALNGHSKGCVG